MHHFLHRHPLILMEAAVTEPLHRMARVALHPELTVSPLIYDARGRAELETLYRGCLQVALEADLPFVMFTPTWRANAERVKSAGAPPTLNQDAVRFMHGLREAHGQGRSDIKIGGLMGCKNDAYRPREGLPPSAAETFHAWQIERLAEAGVDFLAAGTLPAVPEAIGMARAMAKTGRPYIISFVIDRKGCVLDGTPLAVAVGRVDAAVGVKPLGFMVNCSYPTFLRADRQPAALFERLIGYQANASSLDHEALDNADTLHGEDVAVWGQVMLELNRDYGVKLLGGCCGTGVAHLRYIAAHFVSRRRV
jgi:S-methylmethionine-dependent homocysteine/selenocysteine methylase